MRKLIPATVLLLACLAVAEPVGAATPSARSLPGIHIATGHSTLTDPDGRTRTFSFGAIQLRDGRVIGQASLKTFGGERFRLSLNCMHVDGNQAIIGGVITQSTIPEAVGSTGVFAAQDNPDLVTFLLTPDEELPVVDCDTVSASEFLDFGGLPATFVFIR